MAITSGVTAWWTAAASMLPPLAPLVMPVRLLTQDFPLWQALAAVVGCLSFGYLCIRVGAAAFVGGLRRRTVLRSTA